MRMSSFIVGGVAGMIGAMYLMKRKPEAVKAVTNMMSDVKGDMLNKAASSLFASGGSSSSKMESSAKDKSQKNKQDHASNESLIKDIIESDPQLQSQFNEITKESQTVKH